MAASKNPSERQVPAKSAVGEMFQAKGLALVKRMKPNPASRKQTTKNRKGNVRQRNKTRNGLFPIPLPNIPLPVLSKMRYRQGGQSARRPLWPGPMPDGR
jgi:hypothetical protein